ncbi:hypothetical protein [uncultured Helicobacter sp.]|uniref:hypothetical protein n=1 Tax=uncultured Helicobacter sp. TaxID=175537 RepID=UPI00374F7F86
MSVKNDLTQIKNEFDKDGQILENAFRFEILLRRYKKSLIALLVLVMAGIVYMGVSSYLTQQRHTKANEAYREILKAQTPELLETLKQNNPILYDFYLYTHNPSEETLQSLMKSKNELIAQIATYEHIQHTLDSLLAPSSESSTDSNPSEVFATLPALQDKTLQQWLLLQQAAILLQKGYKQEAKDKLMLLDENSDFARIGKALRHYQ